MATELTPARLRARIAAGEGQKTEFKQSFGETKEIIQTLVAFAHARGGVVLVGVTDKQKIVGVQAVSEDFSNAVKRDTQPPLYPTIEAFDLDDKFVVAVSIEPLAPEEVVHAYGKALVRVGKTNQLMSPPEMKRRFSLGFRAENRSESPIRSTTTTGWRDREKQRIVAYERNRGLFLSHIWWPSADPDQVVDIVIYLRQHTGPDQPLTVGSVKSVEYHLGPKFFDRTVVKTDASDEFRLEVSAYGPMLCLARVNFDDGKPPIDLERYIDF